MSTKREKIPCPLCDLPIRKQALEAHPSVCKVYDEMYRQYIEPTLSVGDWTDSVRKKMLRKMG